MLSRPSAARPYTRSCRFEASEPLPFPGPDSIFSSRCGAISGRLRFAVSLSRRDPTETPRFKRSTIGSGSPPAREPAREHPAREPRHPRVAPSSWVCGAFSRPMERARAKSRFFPHFVSFQGFAGRKISASISPPIPSSERPAFGQGRKRRLRSCRASMLFRLAPCARTRAVARGSSPRSECCRSGSCAGSATREVKRVDPKTLIRIRFLRKKNRQKSTPPEFRE